MFATLVEKLEHELMHAALSNQQRRNNPEGLSSKYVDSKYCDGKSTGRGRGRPAGSNPRGPTGPGGDAAAASAASAASASGPVVLPPQPIANFNRNRRREFWNVAARLVRKLEGEEVGVEIDDGCRSERGSSRM